MKRWPPFPATFRFGVATADHQCEAYEDEFGPDIRDFWEARTQTVKRGRGTDFWNRYPGDVELARNLGCGAFRISISWSRVERTPGTFDADVIGHYREVLETIAQAGMVSIVTLHHNSWPVHVEERGGMIADDFPVWFEAYARRISADLGKLITYYVTINEPNQLTFGYVKPWWSAVYAMPPGLERGADTAIQVDAVAKLIRNLFRANARAYNAIHEEHDRRGREKARVGSNPFLLGLPGWLQNFLDFNAMRLREETFAKGNRRFTEPLVHEIGDVDVVVAQFTATLERAAQTNFSEAYLTAHPALLLPSDLHTVTARTFTGPLAVISGTTHAEAAPTVLPAAALVQTVDLKGAVRLLQLKQVEAVFGDDLQLAPLANPDSGLVLFRDPAWSIEESYVAAVAPGNRHLLNAIDVAIKNFKEVPKDGSTTPWDASVTAHIPYLAGQAPPTRWRRTNLSDVAKVTADRPAAVLGEALPKAAKGTALRRIQDRGRLRVGVKPGSIGLCERIGNRYDGVEPDLARFMAMQIFGTPDAVEFRPLTTQQRISKVRSPWRFIQSIVRIVSTLSTILTTNWWHLGMSGRLPTFLCPTECVGKQDYVGMDYYWGIRELALNRIERLFNASVQRYSLAPVWPTAMRKMLARLSKRFPDKDLVIVENGCVDEADGVKRSVYLRNHIREVQRALSDGCRIVAYVCWSITSNREWGLVFGINSNFGLYYVDLDGDPLLARVPKDDSAAVYADIIATRSAR